MQFNSTSSSKFVFAREKLQEEMEDGRTKETSEI